MSHCAYKNNDGEEIPSVTEMIKLLNHKGLMEWANYVGLKATPLKDYLLERSTLGSLVHSRIAEEFTTGTTEFPPFFDPELEAECRRKIDLFHTWREETGAVPLLVEKVMHNERYGGTLDLVAQYKNGHVGLIDFKTGTKKKPFHLLQLGGYLNLLEDCEPDIYKQVSFCSVVVLGKDIVIGTRSVEEMQIYRDAIEKLYMLYMSWKDILWNDWHHTHIIKGTKFFSKDDILRIIEGRRLYND